MAQDDRLGALPWVGAIAGVVAAAWLVPAGLTHRAGSAEDAALGGWLAAILAAGLAGVLPSVLVPRKRTHAA